MPTTSEVLIEISDDVEALNKQVETLRDKAFEAAYRLKAARQGLFLISKETVFSLMRFENVPFLAERRNNGIRLSESLLQAQSTLEAERRSVIHTRTVYHSSLTDMSVSTRGLQADFTKQSKLLERVLDREQGKLDDLRMQHVALDTHFGVEETRVNNRFLVKYLQRNRQGTEGYQDGHFVIQFVNFLVSKLKNTTWYASAVEGYDASASALPALSEKIRVGENGIKSINSQIARMRNQLHTDTVNLKASADVAGSNLRAVENRLAEAVRLLKLAERDVVDYEAGHDATMVEAIADFHSALERRGHDAIPAEIYKDYRTLVFLVNACWAAFNEMKAALDVSQSVDRELAHASATLDRMSPTLKKPKSSLWLSNTGTISDDIAQQNIAASSDFDLTDVRPQIDTSFSSGGCAF